MNRCAEIKALLLPYLHGEAARSERALVHEHLGACQDCQNELAALQQAEALLSRSLHAHAEASTPPAQAWLRLQSALQPVTQPAILAPRGGVLAQLGGVLRRTAPALTAIAIVAAGLQTFIKTPQVIGIPETTPGARVVTEAAAPSAVSAQPIQIERANDALEVRADASDALDLADQTDRNKRARVTQKLVAPRTARRSYLLPPISGELIEDGMPIRPCGVCGQGDAAPSLPVSWPDAVQSVPFAFAPQTFDCVACAAQR